MSQQDFTVIVIDDDMDFSPEDFVLAWNARAPQDDLPLASLKERKKTYDAGWMTIMGNVANVIQIASFIGIPTVAQIVKELQVIRAGTRRSPSEIQSPTHFEIGETIIDLDRKGKVRRITIRRSGN